MKGWILDVLDQQSNMNSYLLNSLKVQLSELHGTYVTVTPKELVCYRFKFSSLIVFTSLFFVDVYWLCWSFVDVFSHSFG